MKEEKEEDIWEAFDRVRKEYGIDKPWESSEDTQYKKDLTKWIENKHQAENPYSFFEEWQESYKIPEWTPSPNTKYWTSGSSVCPKTRKVCPRVTEEGEG